MIVGDSEYSDVLASEYNESFCISVSSFAPTMQRELATIRDGVYLQAYNNESTEFIMDKSSAAKDFMDELYTVRINRRRIRYSTRSLYA